MKTAMCLPRARGTVTAYERRIWAELETQQPMGLCTPTAAYARSNGSLGSKTQAGLLLTPCGLGSPAMGKVRQEGGESFLAFSFSQFAVHPAFLTVKVKGHLLL